VEADGVSVELAASGKETVTVFGVQTKRPSSTIKMTPDDEVSRDE
jgi:hypothetical protein